MGVWILSFPFCKRAISAIKRRMYALALPGVLPALVLPLLQEIENF